VTGPPRSIQTRRNLRRRQNDAALGCPHGNTPATAPQVPAAFLGKACETGLPPSGETRCPRRNDRRSVAPSFPAAVRRLMKKIFISGKHLIDGSRDSPQSCAMARTSTNLELPFEGEAKTYSQRNSELKTVEIYQDPLMESWALPMVSRAVRQAGEGTTRKRQFGLEDLADQRAFDAAVHAARSADVIVVAIYASRDLPDTLYNWVEAWMSIRRRHAGILTALIGVSDKHKTFQTHSYLREVAHRAELDFIGQNRVIANPTPEFPGFSEPAREILPSRSDHHYSWGIND
jgi:hypothetical protein